MFAHECRYPEMSIHQESSPVCIPLQASNDTRHQIPDYDQVADSNSKALNGDSGIEDDRGVRVRNLGEGEKGRLASLQVSRTARLQIQAKSSCETGPDNEQSTEKDSHV